LAFDGAKELIRKKNCAEARNVTEISLYGSRGENAAAAVK